jgi:hypothetical protein
MLRGLHGEPSYRLKYRRLRSATAEERLADGRRNRAAYIERERKKPNLKVRPHNVYQWCNGFRASTSDQAQVHRLPFA